MELYDRIADPRLPVRRLTLTVAQVVDEGEAACAQTEPEQLDMFTDYAAREERRAEEKRELAREKRRQQAVLEIKKRFGKNALLLGVSLMDGATAKERNEQIGGHQA